MAGKIGGMLLAAVARTARGGVERAGGMIATGVALPGRVVELVTEAEGLLVQARSSIASVDTTIAQAGASVARVSRILDATEHTVARTGRLLDSTETTTTQARALVGGAQDLLAKAEPMMTDALPLLEKLTSSISPAEIDAAIKLVDELPVLTESLRTDILPILATLDRVGPDINELLHVMDDVRRAIIGIPGFSFFKKRGAELIEEDDEHEVHPHDADAPRPVSESAAQPLAAGAAAAHRP